MRYTAAAACASKLARIAGTSATVAGSDCTSSTTRGAGGTAGRGSVTCSSVLQRQNGVKSASGYKYATCAAKQMISTWDRAAPAGICVSSQALALYADPANHSSARTS